MTTAQIRQYIENLKIEYKKAGKVYMILVASDIAKDLDFYQRFPMICHAMYDCMENNDEILYKTPSGFSSTLKIKYYL